MFVLDRVDDGEIAAEGRQKYPVSGGDHQWPERDLGQPETTQELIVDAVVWQPLYVRLDDRGDKWE